ncbi:hypothetical protein GCM10011332_30060 [Terasakiella brassicae]|uniref:Uncharacterized protein n=1 Tax=Terasakiella brassicae TaxID=1634917 RepID=A0A917FFX0_9PROT|nr:hypothetical protein GCM10011332_30060 [Terasakiella brassicae]
MLLPIGVLSYIRYILSHSLWNHLKKNSSSYMKQNESLHFYIRRLGETNDMIDVKLLTNVSHSLSLPSLGDIILPNNSLF